MSTEGERYPGDWLPGSLGLVGMAFLVAFFVRVVVFEQGTREWSGLTFAFFAVFFVGVVSSVSLDWLLRRRDARVHPQRRVPKGEIGMMVANIVIERPREVVWAFFTEPAKWESWWGGAVKAAQWREGGEVEWALGGSSPITAFTPGASVLLQGAWMDTTFAFEPEGAGRTAVRIEEGPPKGGASFKDGGAGHVEQLKAALAKLKDLVERETPAAAEHEAAARPGAGPCPHCGGDLKLGPMALAMVSTIGDRGQASVQCGSCGASVTFGQPLPLAAVEAATPVVDAQSAPTTVKADWYADPAGRHQYRYWDGTSWTDHVADGGVASVDPLDGRPTPAKAAEPAPVRAVTAARSTVGQAAGQAPRATGGCKAFQAGRCVVQGSDTGPCDWDPSDWQHCGVVIENRKYGQW